MTPPNAQKLYQEDAYLRTARAQVLDCQKSDKGYLVSLSMNLLYPEGGGQPSDAGFIDNHVVRDLVRAGEGALLHLLDAPVEGEVEVSLDWDRRFDHMQQHTAQHMITAIAHDELGFNTTAFHLGESRSDIELDTPNITDEQKTMIESKVNQRIASHLSVTCRFEEISALDSEAIRSRGLPEDFSGPVRLVEIEGVDTNTCGGTHVANTAELLGLKLLHTESLRGGTRLFYVAGGRMIRMMETMFERERAVTRSLSCKPGDHASTVERILGERKDARRQERALKKELAEYLAKELAQTEGCAIHHRLDGDMEFFRTIAGMVREQNPEAVLLLFSGEEAGLFFLTGPEDKVSPLGKILTKELGMKGGGKGGVLQGKYEGKVVREEAVRRVRGN